MNSNSPIRFPTFPTFQLAPIPPFVFLPLNELPFPIHFLIFPTFQSAPLPPFFPYFSYLSIIFHSPIFIFLLFLHDFRFFLLCRCRKRRKSCYKAIRVRDRIRVSANRNPNPNRPFLPFCFIGRFPLFPTFPPFSHVPFSFFYFSALEKTEIVLKGF